MKSLYIDNILTDGNTKYKIDNIGIDKNNIIYYCQTINPGNVIGFKKFYDYELIELLNKQLIWVEYQSDVDYTRIHDYLKVGNTVIDNSGNVFVISRVVID
ncbi:MAG: hypothetical protein ACRDD7_08650, partial [Peptostreptococcaceae bacterium]